ncbi:MAG: hypothetical protein MSC30_10435 [Gaiellaceae bacterium MAG52_C11]|nr:hypothetical protein [Candidatus Gaiellasilicea maunaloa]
MIRSHQRRGSRHSLVLAAVALALVTLALLASGCGGSEEGDAVAAADPTAQTTTEAAGAAVDEQDPEQALLEFAQCMRDNGIPDFPDPVARTDGSFGFDRPPAGTDFQAWNRVAGGPCSERLADAGLTIGGGQSQSQDDASQAERQDSLLAFAKCMRGEGVKVPDPDPNDPLGALHGLDQQSPTVQAAMSKCQPLLAGAFGH